VLDSIPGAVAAGLVGSVVAGPVVAYALSFVPPRRRRTADWSLIIAAVLFAILADVLTAGPGASGVAAYAIAAFPGLITYLVFRSLLASSFVSLMPMYFIIAIYTRTRVTHARDCARSPDAGGTGLDGRLWIALHVHGGPAAAGRAAA
jgi:hypothetical protein